MQRETVDKLGGGFQLIEQRQMPGIRCHALRARHVRSGAELVLLRSPGDREKLFAAVFRTPPTDSTGVPHILEHCVLCGSKRFPLKDPFMELVKTSMATYINAITYDDRTLYPCASLIGRDFFNLMDVYMDAVFHPLLTRQSFMQEGHRLDLLPSGLTSRMGVVYSEMRGAYADPDDYLERKLRTLMFPFTTYGHCSGGEPDQIPLLTYEAFLEFHRKHYHPSNACLFVMADIPPGEITGFLGERLHGYTGNTAFFPITTEPGFIGPVSGEYPIPGSRRAGSTVLRAWLLDDCSDPVESLAISLLDDILLDSDAAPLREALVGSGLGTGLGPSGYDCDITRPTFTAGLRGVRKGNSDAVFDLVGKTLENCASGLDPDDTINLLHRKELFLRRIGQRWSHGIMGAAAKAWTHGRNPLDELEEEKQLDDLRTRLAKNPRHLEELIQRYFLDSTQRVDAVFTPDPGHFSRLGRNRMKAARLEGKNLDSSERDALKRLSDQLRAHQESPDPPEVLASLPALGLSDIPEEPAVLKWHHEEKTPGIHLLTVPAFTNGVCHINLSLGIAHLPERDLPLAQLVAETVCSVGAASLTYQEASREEMACSGGISAGVGSYEPLSAAGTTHPVISFNASCLASDLPRFLEVLEKRLLSPALSDSARVMDVGREVKSGIHARFLESAGSFAGLESMAALRGGMEVVRRLKGMVMARETCRLVSGKPPTLSRRIEGIWNRVITGAPLVLAWAGPEESAPVLEDFLGRLGGVSRLPLSPIGFSRAAHSPFTGIITDSDVACTAGAFPGREPDDPAFEPLFVLMTLLGNGPLWNQIRGKLGAYGVSSWAAPGLLLFNTYRDPAPPESLSVMRMTFHDPMSFVDSGEKAVRGAVFSTLQRLDPLVRPARAPLTATAMFFTEMDRNYQKKVWQRLLEVDADSLTRAASILSEESEKAVVCVAADRKTLTGMGVAEFIKL
ncbi:MAG: insulinase family protein [Candidatus Fermentibacteraceae bacterium]